jgi:hypothetical protein
MNREQLLHKLHSSFNGETNIKCVAYDRSVARGGWMELIFDSLNCEQLEKIAKFLRDNFSQTNLYSHNLPKLIPCREGISLIFQDKEIERIYGNL